MSRNAWIGWALAAAAGSALLGALGGTGRLDAQEAPTRKDAPAEPAVLTRQAAYRDGETECDGFLAWREDRKGGPLVLIVHDWMGRGTFDEGVARRLAAEGYMGFCVDVYGKGVRPKNAAEARAQAGLWYADREALRRRLAAALAAARQESKAPAAILGYCFGGTCALELARGGAEIAAAVSFHGGLTTPLPAKAGQLKARILALHGADDPYVPPADVAAFMEEMRGAKADWQLVAYGNAVHGFTNPAAGTDKSKGAAYDPAADRRSWRALLSFLEEALR